MQQNVDEWSKIAHNFNEKSNFLYLDAINGKHTGIQSPANNGSEYFDYKETFGIVLMALVEKQTIIYLYSLFSFFIYYGIKFQLKIIDNI